MLKYLFIISIFFYGCSINPDYSVDNWKQLIDPNFNQEKIVNFYKNQVAKVKEGSAEELKIYDALQKALKKAGNNKNIDLKVAKLEGYIVPIDIDNDKVNKFLFFPNQAACIHVPASPANQTIYVETLKNQGVPMEAVYDKITVFGTLHLETTKIALGTASFTIKDAKAIVVPNY